MGQSSDPASGRNNDIPSFFMATVLQVKWVDQANLPEAWQRVRHIGGDSRQFTWQHTLEQAVRFIEEGVFDYYVSSGNNAMRLEVGVAPNGGKYLKTKADTDAPQVLLSQPGFPAPMPTRLAAQPAQANAG